MESFGLFNILQSLMNFFPASSPETEKKPPAPSASVSETEQARNEPDEQEKTEKPHPSQDAVLHFLSAHETRAGRERKGR